VRNLPSDFDRILSSIALEPVTFRPSADFEMRPLPSKAVYAPSSSLLRFLRSQTEGVCFFTSNHHKSPTEFYSPNPIHNGVQACTKTHNGTRHLSTTSRRATTVEASLLSLELFQLSGRHHPSARSLGYGPKTTSNSKSQDGRFTRRYASNDSRHFLRGLWHQFGQTKAKTAVKPPKLPLPPNFHDEKGETPLGWSVGKAPNELKLRCTELDENGNVTLVSGEFKKSELIAKVI
jgi:magnesium transporter